MGKLPGHMKIRSRITSRGQTMAPATCLACLLCFSMPGSSAAQVLSASREVPVRIALKGNYQLSLKFNEYPQYAFDLRLPELAVFDADQDRSRAPEPIDGVWLARRQGNLQVRGSLKAGEKGLDFTCTLKPLSSSSIVLELEVLNTGQADWTDYAQLAVCLAPAETNHPFSDSTGERTYINAEAGGIQSIDEAGEVGDYNHYAVGSRNDPDDPVQRAGVRDGFVARQSSEGPLAISFLWDDAARVDVNPGGLDCMHSHPAVGPLESGDSKILKGFILLQAGTAEDHRTFLNALLDQNRKGP